MESNFKFTENVKKLIDNGTVGVIRNEATINFSGPDERVTLICGVNGYGCSIIRHPGSYGFEQGRWELTVINNIRVRMSDPNFAIDKIDFELNYDTDITQDVEGFLTCEQACKLIEDICKLDANGKLGTVSEFPEENVKQNVIDSIWSIAKISPEHGNTLMDILGDEVYEFVMRNHSEEVENMLNKINDLF